MRLAQTVNKWLFNSKNILTSVSAGGSTQVPATVNHFDEQVEEPIRAFLTVCKKIGGDVGAMVSRFGMLINVYLFRVKK